MKNSSGGDADIGPAHGPDTSKWETDETDHWRPCGYSECNDATHQYAKESHAYDQETVKSEALKSAADCESPATYYKSCVCGKVSTNDSETFTSGNTLTHNWGDWVSNGDGTHTRTCQKNASHKETGNCSGGTATCSAEAICSACSKPYGSTDSSNHTGGTEIRDKKDATTSAEGYRGEPPAGGPPGCERGCGDQYPVVGRRVGLP